MCNAGGTDVREDRTLLIGLGVHPSVCVLLRVAVLQHRLADYTLMLCNDKFIIYEGDECATPGLAALATTFANGYCAVERT